MCNYYGCPPAMHLGIHIITCTLWTNPMVWCNCATIITWTDFVMNNSSSACAMLWEDGSCWRKVTAQIYTSSAAFQKHLYIKPKKFRVAGYNLHHFKLSLVFLFWKQTFFWSFYKGGSRGGGGGAVATPLFSRREPTTKTKTTNDKDNQRQTRPLPRRNREWCIAYAQVRR